MTDSITPTINSDPTDSLHDLMGAIATLNEHDLIANSDLRTLSEIADRIRNKLLKLNRTPTLDMLRKRQSA